MKRRSSGSLSLSQAVVGFVNYKFAEGLTDRSVYSYQRLLNKWIEYTGDKCVAEVSVQDIRQYLAWLRTEYQPRRYNGKTHPISPKTLRNIWVTLASFFKWAGQEFDICSGPPSYTLEEVASMAKEAALMHGGHVPVIIVEGGSRSVVGQLANLPRTHAGRLQVLFAAGAALAQSGDVATLRQVFFISEGWMSSAKKGEAIEAPPSQDPNRKEVLIINSSSDVQARRASLVVFELLRDGEGQLVELEQLHTVEDEDLRVASPLLSAFVEGFRLEMRGKLN